MQIVSDYTGETGKDCPSEERGRDMRISPILHVIRTRATKNVAVAL